MGKNFETTTGCVWPLFLTAHAVVVEAIENRLATASLPPLAWYDVLWGLERAEGSRLRMSELAQKIVFSRSNLTRLVDRLEEARLVMRERAAADRRGAFAVLTEEGARLRKQMWPHYAAGIRELFDSQIDEAEAAALGVVLRRVLDHIRGNPESGARTAGKAVAKPAGT